MQQIYSPPEFLHVHGMFWDELPPVNRGKNAHNQLKSITMKFQPLKPERLKYPEAPE